MNFTDVAQMTGETLLMTVLSTLFAYLLGLPCGILLNITSKNGLKPCKWLNFTVGLEWGKGRALKDVLAGKNTVAEGVFTASAVLERAATAGVEMPICEGLLRIMNDGATVDNVIAALLARPFKAE